MLDDNLKAKTPVIIQLVKAVERSVDNTALPAASVTPTCGARRIIIELFYQEIDKLSAFAS